MHVLIVDDNLTNRKLPAAILGKAGCTIVEAEDGEQALQRLAEQRFDCVLLDISLPGINGDEVCRRIRENPELAQLKVVAYTAHAMCGDGTRIMDAGFDTLITKPISRQVLLEAIGLPF